MADLQELFNRLKTQSQEAAAAQSQSSGQPSIWAEPQQQLYQQPSVSSPLFSPPAHTPNPVHSSNIISPVNPSSMMGTPAPDQNKTNNLLNLLKSSNQGGQSSSHAGPMASLQNVGRTSSGSIPLLSGQGGDSAHSRPLSAQDLVASLQRQPSASVGLPSPMARAGAEKTEGVTSSSGGDSKNFLLNLLTKPKETKPTAATTATQPEGSSAYSDPSIDNLAQGFAEASLNPAQPPRTQREPTPVRQFGAPSASQTSFEAPQSTKASQFNYVNPFDQLHSSSPLNRTPKPDAHGEPKKIEILKHNREVSSALNGESAAPAAKSRKLEDISPAPSPAPAQEEKSKSVSETLEGVGEKVNQEVEEALRKADEQEKDEASKAAPADTGDNTADDDKQIKQEMGEDDDEIESSWESAEDEAERTDNYTVEVYNFPMKPWTSIQIKSIGTPRAIRQDNFTPVAKMKKDFDQIDRQLVTASHDHILYAQVANKKDNGGFRIVRQDSGNHKQVFRSSGERIFNVQICNTVLPGGSDVETVLGTGVNGSLFWTSLAKSRGEFFVDDDVEAQGFIMPPVATQEEQTSGSPVKTRAKMSSRHPEYFGMARGKHIHIVAPDTVKSTRYCDKKTKKVNTAKYLTEHGLKIMTGKAGKDFCFSEDDSMIVSLDKAGQLKFWDIKELTSRATDISEGKHEPVELREPVWSLSAATSGSKPDEKPSVSSIMFLDKERPTMKGVALRYVLIGFKQNHILQLWDLGLHKAVQEIRLPHEQDSDGICSITYHPRSGIIALGHPTRNSIYFIHLSAPRYNFSHMDQAKYINLLARNDPSLPRPESTAIMSGLREFSFAKVGQLRSLDMLRYSGPESDPDSDETTLFELYVSHSKGVVGIHIKRKDLGWDKDSKMVKPVDAVEAGIISVHELVPPQKLPPPSESDTPVKQTGKPKKPEPAKPSASTTAKNEPVTRESAPSAPAPAISARTNITPPPRAERPSMQVPEAPLPSQQPSTNPPLMTAESYAMAAQRAKSPPPRDKAARDAANAAKRSVTSPTATAAAPHVSSDGDLQAMLAKQFDALYQRIDADKRVVDAAGAARQDAMLRLVSSTLTENVEKSLTRIVSGSIEKEIVPAVTSSTNKVLEKKVAEILPQQLNANVSREVKAALPGAIQQALKDPQVHRAITDQVATKVQQQLSQLLQQSMPNVATQAAQKMVSDLDARTKQQVSEIEKRRVQDQNKIQELSDLVRSLSETVSNMSASQVAFQDEILKMQRARSQAGTAQDAASAVSAAEKDPQAEAEDQEVQKITQLLVNGQYDQATIEWLQSARQGELFDQVFVRVNPRYLEKVTPLVALSVSAAITASFETYVDQRLEWLSTILSNIDLNDEEIKDVAGKIMEVLSQRLQGAYMNISETNPSEPALRRISALHRQVAEVRRMAG